MRLSRKGAWHVALVVASVALVACASPQRLSASIYAHEQRAAAHQQAVVRLGRSQ
jgi:outer membrane lipoprotein SlyB